MKVQALVFVLLLLPGEAIAADKELAEVLELRRRGAR